MINGLNRSENTDFVIFFNKFPLKNFYQFGFFHLKIHDGVNLFELPGNGPLKFGLECVKKLFSKEELIKGTLEPSSRTERLSLDPVRVTLLRGLDYFLRKLKIAFQIFKFI